MSSLLDFNKRSFNLACGDSIDVLKTLPDNSIDSIVTDPPYGLSNHGTDEVIACLTAWISGEPYQPKGKGFMGKSWDAWVPGPEIWKECMRVLKPGGHMLVFAGTRSMDLMSMSMRLAGFELRDSIGYAHEEGGGAPLLAWSYGSGMPKGLDVSKAIEAHLTDVRSDSQATGNGSSRVVEQHCHEFSKGDDSKTEFTPTTDEAKQWDGWKTSIKPAWEPIILARKPLEGTVASNVLKYGTGALNIDGCRVAVAEEGGRPLLVTAPLREDVEYRGNSLAGRVDGSLASSKAVGSTNTGRWPANVIHDGSEEVLSTFPAAPGQQGDLKSHNKIRQSPNGCFGKMAPANDHVARIESDKSAARFFYCAKASRADRNAGLDDPGAQFKHGTTLRKVENTQTTGNNHPTVKPVSLMSYLCKLVTPPNGVILDPFNGSGSTGKGSVINGFNYIGIDISQDYIDISEKRIQYAVDNKEKILKELSEKQATSTTNKSVEVISDEEDTNPFDKFFREDNDK